SAAEAPPDRPRGGRLGRPVEAEQETTDRPRGGRLGRPVEPEQETPSPRAPSASALEWASAQLQGAERVMFKQKCEFCHTVSAAPEALETLVKRGETLGYHSTVIADHVVFPMAIASKYPYTVSGAFPGGGDALEQLTLMAFVAAKSTRLRLITSVMILPHRNP